MKIIALLLLALVCSTFAVSSVTLSGNVSVNSVGQKEFNYRQTNVGLFDLFKFGYYVSTSVTGAVNASSGNVNGDLIIGVITYKNTPRSYFGYISAHVDYNVADLLTFDYSIAGGFIVSSYMRIDERDTSGNTVRTVKLSDLSFSASKGDSNGGLTYVTLKGANPLFSSPLNDNENVELTFLISKVLGTVTIDGATTPVTPKTLESFIEISGWQYKDSTNHLVLVCGVVTGSGSGQSEGHVDIAVGSGENQVYADFSREVVINGVKGTASVNKTVASNINIVLDDVTLQAQAQAVYKGSITGHIVEISLPAGASKIVYDPTIGSGTPLVETSSGAVTILSVLFVAVVMLLL